jgi:DNA modification methylase
MPTPVLIQAESRAIPLADQSVHMICTSPPYWSLRDYCVSGQIGLEQVHDCNGAFTGQSCGDCYICHMREVARECWRVLRDDGTFWCNMGDSYNAAGREGHGTRIGYKQGTNRASANGQDTNRATAPGLKPKNLLGVPWRLALALQADGWTLRSEIIWAKLNPMPESVLDRPTRAHEQVFLFSKSERYFYDAEAIREPNAGTPPTKAGHAPGTTARGYPGAPQLRSSAQARQPLDGARNARSVWTIATEPTPYLHFATFPTALVRKCILAGTSAHGVCSACGAPWVQEMVRTTLPDPSYNGSRFDLGKSAHHGHVQQGERFLKQAGTWRPTCMHDAPLARPIVFDPFCGSATTLLVARELGRDSVGTDLSRSYLKDIARKRLGLTALDAWQGKASAPMTVSYGDLPLFTLR